MTRPFACMRARAGEQECGELRKLKALAWDLRRRIEDAEAALLVHDPAYQDEYWKRHPVENQT